jgi:hydrogenase maturation protein HypF
LTLYRVVWEITGLVQGVGFRPGIARLARSLGVRGSVRNDQCNVMIEAFGIREILDHFEKLVRCNTPQTARIDTLRRIEETPADASPENFRIVSSTVSLASNQPQWNILPDLATCPACLEELFSPADRRYLYPFINCTLCGPRWTIIENMPYDRERTSMKDFTMCEQCRREFDNPDDRRYHAQPIACPDCGPHVTFLDRTGHDLARQADAIALAIQTFESGGIIAVKGIGGFHLMADATNPDAVHRLRQRKNRPHKPFAVMMPGIPMIRQTCYLDSVEETCLKSAAAPIVLLKKRSSCWLPPAIAGGINRLGVMLPYAPIHHILMREFGRPVIATSGNRPGEPLCRTNQEALTLLNEFSDGFLVNNRPIIRSIDDSVVQVIEGEIQMIRAARGYIPLSFQTEKQGKTALALGAHEKNTVSFLHGRQAVFCGHIGDLDTAAAIDHLSQTVTGLQDLFVIKPETVVCDHHPGYGTHRVAESLSLPISHAWHHIAHAAACMIENDIRPPFSAIIWDGTGLGPDGFLWGGEFFHFDGNTWKRRGSLEPFLLPGGEKAIRQPWRTALSLLFHVFGDDFFKIWRKVDSERFPLLQPFIESYGHMLFKMWRSKINSPQSTSMGRLFDGIAGISETCLEMTFEAQAPMLLESLLDDATAVDGDYAFSINKHPDGSFTVGWNKLISEVFYDITRGVAPADVSMKFHLALVDLIVNAANELGESRVIVSGGCFQNSFLTGNAIIRLEKQGFTPFGNRRVPPNDAGISLGQLLTFEP